MLYLSASEAAALAATGRRMASQVAWWGDDQEDADARERTVVRVAPRGDDLWEVRVSDAVGVVSAGSVQLVIRPKIDIGHLLFLFAASGEFPRLGSEQAAMARSSSLWELLAAWLVGEMERAIRKDLVRDYHEETEVLSAARGQLAAVTTAGLYYSGRLAFACHYDEFGLNSPLNRVLKAGAQAAAGSPLLPMSLRRRAIRITTRMEDVGRVTPRDFMAQIDRRSAHWSTAYALARHVLRYEGRAFAEGGQPAWSFLIRTPEMVEAGIRNLLAASLGRTYVAKRGRQAEGSTLTFNPDLVFGRDLAVADVKYKLSAGDWTRSDLYQVITFAEAFQTRSAAVIRFREAETPKCATVRVGMKEVHELTWLSDATNAPEQAAAALVADAAAWLTRTGEINQPRLAN